MQELKNLFQLSKDLGIILLLKYKLGIAKEGIDFISIGQNDQEERNTK